jgi:biotin carboxylase
VLVLTSHSYRLEAFLKAAQRVGVRVTVGQDVPPAHRGAEAGRLRLDFRDPEHCISQAQAWAHAHPLHAVIPTDDATVILAAQLSEELDLQHNSIESAEAARDKLRMRQRFAARGANSPWFRAYAVNADPAEIAPTLTYPCVIKPICLSGSRGVMRVDSSAELPERWARLAKILATVPSDTVLIEGYLPGAELALEGLLDHGQLHVLALFDKPDPLEGPFFEETIYVTPSRQPAHIQAEIARQVARAAEALGLREGAVHAEVRVNDTGVWLLEIAGRSIGGLCSQTLRFAQSADVTLEELIVRQAVGLPIPSTEREGRAGGVMMIPIPRAGTLRGVRGVTEAQALPFIEAVEITAPLNYPLAPLPEGESYLGFIFARGATPAEVEAALRAAHARLEFEIETELPIL